MAVTKPSLVIVPGSFSRASLYDSVAENLRKRGYETVVGELPSASRNPPAPGATMEEDAAYFHDIAEKLSDQGKDVVIVTHSYGGIPGTESAKGLAKTDREAEGKKGGVVRIVYLASIIAEIGKSSGDTMGDLVLDCISIEGDYMVMDPIPAAELIFSDLAFDERLKLSKEISRHSTASFAGPLTYPAYKYIPVAYIVCEQDKIIPPAVQRGWIEMLEQQIGKPVPTVYLNTGHCPNASFPEDVANAVNKLIVEL